MRALVWLLRLCVFALLFALALNNQHDAALKTLFGHEWRAPMIFIVLAAFVLGCAAGVAGMLPSWWRRRGAGSAELRPPADANAGAGSNTGATRSAPAAPGNVVTDDAVPLDHPPRDGL